MTALPESFRRDGYRYSQLRRSGNLALYEIEHPGFHAGFEIVRVKADSRVESWGYNGIAAAKAKFIALDGRVLE